jgi:dipeptidyl aminopeptidase/acylaminoacyl peptidase
MMSRLRTLTGGVLLTASSLALGTLVGAPAHSAFPGDNGLIAYTALTTVDGRETSQIFTVGADGTGRTRITRGGQSYGPAFSPSGRRLAVARDDGTRSGVWVVGLGGSWIRRVTAFPPGVAGQSGYGDPAWSADGSRIAYVHDGTLWVVGSDGTDAQPVVDPAVDPAVPPTVLDPAWSPDGSRIAFSGWNDITAQFRVYSVMLDGSELVALTSGESADPTWSPDGTRLAYTRSVAGNSDLWVVNADGSEPRSVTNTAGSLGREMHPAWSPNGSRIAFHDFMVERGVLATVKVDGTGRREVSRQPRAGLPDWQADLRAPSTTSLNYATMRKLRVNGQVDPAHAGRVVSVELAVQRGGRWTTVATRSVSLSALSRYVVTFDRRSEFLCRLTARFPGDGDHKPSTSTKTFSC